MGIGMHVQVKEITGGSGVNVVYDPVGGDMWDASMRCAANSARLLVIGFASGKVPQVPANILLSRNLDVLGFYVGAYFGEQCVPSLAPWASPAFPLPNPNPNALKRKQPSRARASKTDVDDSPPSSMPHAR